MLRRRVTTRAQSIAWRRISPASRVAADAPPLLLIHGFACGMGDWGGVTRVLARAACRDVLVFDNRGVGGSAAPDGPLTIPQMATDALEVASAAGADRFDVMGISLVRAAYAPLASHVRTKRSRCATRGVRRARGAQGGMIAQQLALDHPERTRRLVLGCTTHGGREATPAPAAFYELCQEWSREPEPNESGKCASPPASAQTPCILHATLHALRSTAGLKPSCGSLCRRRCSNTTPAGASLRRRARTNRARMPLVTPVFVAVQAAVRDDAAHTGGALRAARGARQLQRRASSRRAEMPNASGHRR